MLIFTFAWFAGDLLLQNAVHLPAWQFCVSTLLLNATIILLLHRLKQITAQRFALVSLIILSSFSYAAFRANEQLAWSIPANLQQKTVFVRGTIIGLPTHRFHQNSVLFQLQNWSYSSKTKLTAAKLHLAFPETITLHVGDSW